MHKIGVCSLLIWLLCIVAIKVQSKSILADTLTSTAPLSVSMVKSGVPDTNFINPSNHRRVRRYVFSNTRWKSNSTISYRVDNGPTYPNGHELLHPEWYGLLNKTLVENLVDKAFEEWAPYCGLKFKRRQSGLVDITFSFQSRSHGLGCDFEGSGGVVAHARFPSNDGSWVHFDDEEIWVVDRNNTQLDELVEFYPIALHEIGHALGLHESKDKDSIMYVEYDPSMRTLQQDDKDGMRALYDL